MKITSWIILVFLVMGFEHKSSRRILSWRGKLESLDISNAHTIYEGSCLEVVCRFFNHGSRIYLKTKVTKATTEERTQSQMGVFFCSLINPCFYFVCLQEMRMLHSTEFTAQIATAY
jgi:hypothetical protein